MLCSDHLHVLTLGLGMALSVLLKRILILSAEIYTADSIIETRDFLFSLKCCIFKTDILFYTVSYDI